jgi:hypothetical protein
MAFPYFVPGVINTDPITAIPFGNYYSSPAYVTSEIEISVYKDKDRLPTKTERLQVSTLPTTGYYYPTSMFYAVDPLVYSYPVYSNVSYQDVNSDKELHKKVSKRYFSELYNRYIPESFPKILNFVRLTAKDIELVKSANEAKNNSTKDEEFGEKINYLADYIFTKKDVYNSLWNYVEKRNIKWWDLKYYEDDIENLLVKAVEDKIREMILE